MPKAAKFKRTTDFEKEQDILRRKAVDQCASTGERLCDSDL